MKKVRYWAWVLVVGYIVFILSETIIDRLETDECKYKLLPFWSYLALIRGEGVNIWRCIYLNVLFFIPLGALLWLAFKNRKWWKALLFSIVLSLCVEIAQLVLKRGLCEFDDVFHNALGGMIGFFVCGLVAKVWLMKNEERGDGNSEDILATGKVGNRA